MRYVISLVRTLLLHMWYHHVGYSLSLTTFFLPLYNILLHLKICDAEDLSLQTVEDLVKILRKGLPFNRSFGVDGDQNYNEFEARRKEYHVKTMAVEMIRNAKRFLAFQSNCE